MLLVCYVREDPIQLAWMVNQIGSYCGPSTTPLSFFSRICRLRRQMREKKEAFAERFVVAANLIHHLDK